MDLVFNCPSCKQQLEADSSMSGTAINCPSCGSHLVIPEPDITNIRPHNPIATSAAAREEHHFSVPVHDAPSEVLVQKPQVPVDMVASHGKKHLRIRVIRHTDCIEVGHDRYEEIVSDFLRKVGEPNIVSINSINYTHVDMGSRQLMTEFGVMIVYKG